MIWLYVCIGIFVALYVTVKILVLRELDKEHKKRMAELEALAENTRKYIFNSDKIVSEIVEISKTTHAERLARKTENKGE